MAIKSTVIRLDKISKLIKELHIKYLKIFSMWLDFRHLRMFIQNFSFKAYI